MVTILRLIGVLLLLLIASAPIACLPFCSRNAPGYAEGASANSAVGIYGRARLALPARTADDDCGAALPLRGGL